MFLFAKLACGTFGRKDDCRPHFDAQASDKATLSEPLGVLPAQMPPFCLPSKVVLLKGGEVGGGLFGDAFEGERFGSSQDIVEAMDDGKGRLVMVPDCDAIAI
jgi:hypothetical protein